MNSIQVGELMQPRHPLETTVSSISNWFLRRPSIHLFLALIEGRICSSCTWSSGVVFSYSGSIFCSTGADKEFWDIRCVLFHRLSQTASFRNSHLLSGHLLLIFFISRRRSIQGSRY